MGSRLHPALPAALVAAAAGLLWLVLAPRTPDLAAQVYRSGLFAREGFAVYDGNWYGGHHLPGYSLLFPPLGALLGVRAVGVVSAVASAVLFERLASGHFGEERARRGALWLALATAADLCIGRLTFGLGVAVGLGALLALQRGHPRWAALLALACTAASPVAGLFLALAGVSLAIAGPVQDGPWAHPVPRRDGLLVAVPALGLAAALAAAFPEGGRQPFTLTEAALVLASAAAVAGFAAKEERVLRRGALLYALAVAAAYALPTPMGSNAARLGATFAAPLVLCLRPRPRAAALLALVALAGWQWWAPVREIAKGAGDPSTHAAYYAGVAGFLQADARAHGPARVEVPFTRSHWEAAYLAPRVPLARGWETQLDTKLNGLFYERGRALSATRYRAWLRRNGVRWVAVPDAAPDPSARAELALVRSPAAATFLRPAYADAHWRVYAVRGGDSLTEGAGHLTRLGSRGFTLRTRGPGRTLVRVHFTRWWQVRAPAAAHACATAAGGGWTAVHTSRAATIHVTARLTPARLLTRDTCR